MDAIEVRRRYSQQFSRLDQTAEFLAKFIQDYIPATRIDRICARAKSVDSFVAKSQKLNSTGDSQKYLDPFNSIQDQIGVRIIVLYKSDVDRVSQLMQSLLSSIEEVRKIPKEYDQFGYEGKHFIMAIPNDVKYKINNYIATGLPPFFELQIKTVFQHAWGEANHDLFYKSGKELCQETKRKIAFTAAQSWGADQIFDEIIRQQELE